MKIPCSPSLLARDFPATLSILESGQGKERVYPAILQPSKFEPQEKVFNGGKLSIKSKVAAAGLAHLAPSPALSQTSTMMRRCILEFSSSRSVRRIPRQITTQKPFWLISRKELSVASQQNASQRAGSAGKPPESGSNISKVVIGSIAVGAVVVAAYQTGYLGQPPFKDYFSIETKYGGDNEIPKGTESLGEQVFHKNNQGTTGSRTDVGHIGENNEVHLDLPTSQDLRTKEDVNQVQDKVEVSPVEDTIPVQEKEFPSSHQDSITVDSLSPHSDEFPSSHQDSTTLDGQSPHSDISVEEGSDLKNIGNGFTHAEASKEHNKGDDTAPIFPDTKAVPEEAESKTTPVHQLSTNDIPEDKLGKDAEPSSALLDAYFLQEKDERKPEISSSGEGYAPFSPKKEASLGVTDDLKNAYISEDGKLVLDFLEAIHAAEKTQAELDARVFTEERRTLKEKYEKELKDARARELMYAEEAAILDKELNKEKAKNLANIKSLQEKAEENLKMELERKENEVELQLKKVQELAKAELAAAIASEKASQIEKMAEANLNINALCMAFYARSEEARQTHSVHRLALGALALEDALAKGLPIQTEINVLHAHLEGIDKDSLLGLVLSSLPEETLKAGADTQLQLNEKFDSLKGLLRHYSLIPSGGGGILAHSLAHVASWLKVKEDQSGDGIESVISRVESFLAEGKLAEAAEALEQGVHDSQAEEIVGDWVRRARNRAITEQALSLLQSYATSLSLTY
ncbi:MICOS complex subunit MIC60 isoform X1 [Macadamia integrifolia]|uniref:MICOS complex subunit MIC60 isoform X1 n=1 Tax=Macadamia integrifolia TaxID=60698 RepID=UPI001C4E6619|nr:MICOS complex subunit MIC60 isoform X1 [Macadamia integrifolia]